MERNVLACDVGGTNTSVALLTGEATSWQILRRFRFQTQQLTSLEEAVNAVLAELSSDPSVTTPTAIAVSGAGPIRDGVCHLTNAPWTISATVLGEKTGLTPLLINDFSAVSYGIPLLDTSDKERVTVLDGGTTPTEAGVRLVVGAGTGLGVGYLVQDGSELRVYPSEGGHSAFAPYDEESGAMHAMLAAEIDEPPGSELFVSGRGIANTWRHYRETRSISPDSPIAAIPEEEDAAMRVSAAAAKDDPDAVAIMRLFVRNYARVCSVAALHFLPTGGLYLAGGIVTKNERWFTDGDLFMSEFRKNYRPHISDLLTQFPVYVVRDYEISLYGAAHATAVLLGKEKR